MSEQDQVERKGEDTRRGVHGGRREKDKGRRRRRRGRYSIMLVTALENAYDGPEGDVKVGR